MISIRHFLAARAVRTTRVLLYAGSLFFLVACAAHAATAHGWGIRPGRDVILGSALIVLAAVAWRQQHGKRNRQVTARPAQGTMSDDSSDEQVASPRSLYFQDANYRRRRTWPYGTQPLPFAHYAGPRSDTTLAEKFDRPPARRRKAVPTWH